MDELVRAWRARVCRGTKQGSYGFLRRSLGQVVRRRCCLFRPRWIGVRRLERERTDSLAAETFPTRMPCLRTIPAIQVKVLLT